MPASTYSFDVFDTCVTRVFASPADLFRELAVRVLREGGGAFSREDLLDIARLRRSAEARARHESNRGDVTLSEIYAQAEGLRRWNLDPKQVARREIELELESIRPVESMRARVENLRAAGHTIVFISDMYLPAEIIQRMLEQTGFYREGDALYVSGEKGLTKRDGTLFELVGKELGLKTSDWRHVGDHGLSDYAVPARMGIKAEHFIETALTSPEREIVGRGIGGDEHLRSLAAGISRCARLSVESVAGSGPALNEIASTAAGPLLISYTAWVLREAARRNIKVLYFVSRDGQVLKHIADALSEYTAAPECRYLYGSRQAWFIASGVEHLDEWLHVQGHSPAPAHLLRKLNVRVEELSEAEEWKDLLREPHRPLEPAGLEKLRELLKREPARALVRARGEAAFSTTADYLRANGLADDEAWALVDIGWTLKTQRALARILKRMDAAREPDAFYLGVTRNRLNETGVGEYRSFFTHDVAGLPTREDALFEHINLVEQVFTMADHGSVPGYENTPNGAAPILTESGPAERTEFARNHRAALVRLAREYGRAGFFADDTLDASIAVLRDIALAGLNALAREPSTKQARALSWIEVGDDQNESRKCALVRRLGPADALREFLYSLKGRHPDPFQVGYQWRAGSLAVSGALTRYLFRRGDALRSRLRRSSLLRALLRRDR